MFFSTLKITVTKIKALHLHLSITCPQDLSSFITNSLLNDFLANPPPSFAFSVRGKKTKNKATPIIDIHRNSVSNQIVTVKSNMYAYKTEWYENCWGGIQLCRFEI